MPKRHTVKLGDCSLSVAAENGAQKWKAVWDAPENKALRAKRDDPFTLSPGDELVIPDVTPKKVAVATGQTHTFVVTRPKARVRVRLMSRALDGAEKATSGASCSIKVGDTNTKVTTDGEGWCEAVVPAQATQALLTVEGAKDRPAARWTLALGALRPAKEREGAAARLANLGYGVAGEDPLACLPYALRAFQEDAKLTVTGELDAATMDALRPRHGV